MSSANLDLRIDQGADWAVQIYWTSSDNTPFKLSAPMRMEIRNEVGGVAVTLQTNDTSLDAETNPDNQTILYNPDSGLIQLMLTGDQTSKLGPGHNYAYDLFVHYSDPVTGTVRKKNLIGGSVTVNRRSTQNV